jgi:peptidoglycan/LPS O-acetylase OafA/YrhL
LALSCYHPGQWTRPGRRPEALPAGSADAMSTITTFVLPRAEERAAGESIDRDSLRTRRFSALDGLRAYAIAFVVWFHTSPAAEGEGIFGRGLGVTLFFTISGFLITTVLLRERARTGDIALRPFYIRRVLRIFPLYYTVLLLYVALVGRFEHGTDRADQFFANLPSFVTFTANWFVRLAPGHKIIFYFAWSLSTQEQFYLAWPLVLRFARSPQGPVAVMTLALATGEITRWCVAAGLLSPEVLAVRILASIASAICLGCLLAFLVHREASASLAYRLAGHLWCAPLAIVLVLLPVVFTHAPLLLTSLAMAYLVMVCAVRPGVLKPLLDNKLARHVGTISYGIYLLHMLALNVVRRLLLHQGRFVVFACTMTLTTLAATLSYRYFERPFLGLKSRFGLGGASSSA